MTSPSLTPTLVKLSYVVDVTAAIILGSNELVNLLETEPDIGRGWLSFKTKNVKQEEMERFFFSFLRNHVIQENQCIA